MKKIMQNLRVQLLLSHLLLVLLMAVVMSGAVVSFFHLGGSIGRILRNNYDSVVAAQDMKETLERQDSAASFFLAGQVDRARKQYEANDPLFLEAYNTEANNVTERGEQEAANDIGARFPAYRQDIRRLLYANPPMSQADGTKYYFATLEPEFSRLKQRAQDILLLNQTAILSADKIARHEAEKAARLGIAVTVMSALLATLLAFQRINSATRPLVLLARQAEAIGAGRLDERIDIRRNDEIGALAVAINDMAAKLRVARIAYLDRLQRAERMSDAAVENLYDPVLITDAEGHVVHLNRAAEGLFGSARSADGKYVAEVVGEPRITRAIERAVRQEHVSADEGDAALVSIRGAADALAARVYRLRVTPMVTARDVNGDDGHLIGAVAVLEDVTYLQEVDRLKTEFIGVASHELRTPVTSLLMSVDLLREGAAGALNPMQLEVVNAQKEDLQRLERMMHELLDLTRLESGVQLPRFEIVAPHELADACRRALKAQATAKGVALRTEVSELLPGVRADRGQITRVLMNLLSNAIRHTDTGGVVTLRATQVAESAAVEFAVRDTGSGIPAEYLPHIFERFVQVPGATKGGAGLGLSIAQTIVRAHGDEIKVTSEVKRGTVFMFRLPTAGAA